MANPDKFLPQLEPAEIISEAGILRSITHDDIYFSVEDGLAETRHVFLDGTNLRDSLLTRSHLVIAETGFGTARIYTHTHTPPARAHTRARAHARTHARCGLI